MSLVLLERPEDGIALLRMNRPEAMNALNNAAREELATHYEALNADGSVEFGDLVILSGIFENALGGDTSAAGP